MTLIYAFSNQWGTNISHRTLLELKKIMFPSLSKEGSGVDFELVKFSPKPFFNKYIKNNRYDLIIGLGDLYGNFQKIRIETQTKNNYQNEAIYPFSPILLDLSLPSVDNYDPAFFQISSNMGTYNCNFLAYSTQNLIEQKNYTTKHLFLHLPPKSNASILAQKIHSLLVDNSVISHHLSA